jgi:hypothetical protein
MTKIFINVSLAISFVFTTGFLFRDAFVAKAEISQYHVILIVLLVAFSLINKEFSRRMIEKMKSFEISSDGFKLNFNSDKKDEDDEDSDGGGMAGFGRYGKE